MHVSTHRRHYTGKDGTERVYETHLLRRSYREGGRVKNETVANLSHLPAEVIELIRRSLAGEALVAASAAATITRSCRTGTWPQYTSRPRRWACPGYSARPGGSGIWRWR